MKNVTRNLSNVSPIQDPRYGAIFELAGQATGLAALGLAWVEVNAGAVSPLHFHRRMSEIYYVVAGKGVMRLGDVEVSVSAGDCISIRPGIIHAIGAVGTDNLTLIVATAPAYDFDPSDDVEVETLG